MSASSTLFPLTWWRIHVSIKYTVSTFMVDTVYIKYTVSTDMVENPCRHQVHCFTQHGGESVSASSTLFPLTWWRIHVSIKYTVSTLMVENACLHGVHCFTRQFTKIFQYFCRKQNVHVSLTKILNNSGNLRLIIKYRSGTVNSNMVNSKFHQFEVPVSCFPIISCLKYTVNSYFHLIRSKTLLTNDSELAMSDL